MRMRADVQDLALCTLHVGGDENIRSWYLLISDVQECKILNICKCARSCTLHLSWEGWTMNYCLILPYFNVQECNILHVFKCARSCTFTLLWGGVKYRVSWYLLTFDVQECKILHMRKLLDLALCTLHGFRPISAGPIYTGGRKCKSSLLELLFFILIPITLATPKQSSYL